MSSADYLFFQSSYKIEREATEPDPYVIELNNDLSMCDDALSARDFFADFDVPRAAAESDDWGAYTAATRVRRRDRWARADRQRGGKRRGCEWRTGEASAGRRCRVRVDWRGIDRARASIERPALACILTDAQRPSI